LLIEVEDTGPGISPEDQKMVFERFRQGSHKRAGSGLGLHLSRRIVETHQGTLEVKSELGKGSVFVVCLPTQKSAA
jgi:signal transduction histidine kinase